MRKPCHMDSLPQDLLVEIATQLASLSSAPLLDIKNLPLLDIKNLRTTCKTLRAASNARKVGRCMAVYKEWNKHWWDKEGYLQFLRHCAKSGNLQASYILGLEHIYNQRRMVTGLRYLRKATAGGHRVAAYTLGVLNFCCPPNRSLGMDILSRVADGDLSSTNADVIRGTISGNSNINACRKEALEVLRMLTMRKMSLEPRAQCGNQSCGKIVDDENMWLPNEEQCKSFCSQECRWRDEVYVFSSLM